MKSFLLNVFFLLIPTTILAETSDDTKALLEELFKTRKYNKNVRPVINQTHAVQVLVDFFLLSIVEFDERRENLKTSGFLDLMWTDEHMSWENTRFNDISTIFVSQDDIWKPDITLKNSYSSIKEQGSSFLLAVVSSDGEVSWLPSEIFESTCSMTITYFPFDVQTCTLKFSAWSYNKKDVELKVRGATSSDTSEYIPSALWDVIKTSAKTVNSTNSEVEYTFTLKRKPRFYVITIIIPLILLSLLNTFSFVLPVTSGERAGYSITVFLSLAIFLTIISDQLPNNSENTSILAVYIMSVTTLSTSIVLVCLIQLRMQSWYDTEQPVNRFFERFVSFVNYLRCQRCKKASVVPDSNCKPSNISVDTKLSEQKGNKGIDIDETASNTYPDKEAKQPEITWLDVVNAMDFMFFLFSFSYTFICTVVFGIVAVTNA